MLVALVTILMQILSVCPCLGASRPWAWIWIMMGPGRSVLGLSLVLFFLTEVLFLIHLGVFLCSASPAIDLTSPSCVSLFETVTPGHIVFWVFFLLASVGVLLAGIGAMWVVFDCPPCRCRRRCRRDMCVIACCCCLVLTLFCLFFLHLFLCLFASGL